MLAHEKRKRMEISMLYMEKYCKKKKIPLKDFIENLEKNIIIRALSQFNGNQKDAAIFLGMKYTTLHAKVKKYSINFEKKPI